LERAALWSFVGSKQHAGWIWLALEHQMRRLVGLAFGDRAAATCQERWPSLPADYRQRALCYSDFWHAYCRVLPPSRHRRVGQERGQTALVERVNNTLRQRCANVVRKSLSCSKDPALPQVRIRLFVDHRHQELRVKHSALIRLD
jgi:IS1 family transposase